MRLRADQLTHHLNKSLLPVYFISGNEPLLREEVTTEIANAAKAMGFLERRVFQVESHFDWENFLNDAFTLSLFSAKGIVELHFMDRAPNAAANKALQTWFERFPAHRLLIITIAKLDAGTQKTSWFKMFDQKGALIQIWPVERHQLPGWLSRRAQQRGLKFSTEAIALLADRVEGNLMAAVQALDRMALLCFDSMSIISCEEVLKAVGEQAQFTIFDLSEALLRGDLKRAYRIFYLLKAEGVEPLFILNILAKEIRLLAFVSLNPFVMVRIKIQNLLPRNLVLPKLKQLGYVLAKRQITLLIVTALIASCKIL
jgi:DNA polymerase-3 subunit delta